MIKQDDYLDLIKRWATVDWLIDHYGSDEDEYFAQLVCEKYDLEEKIAKLRRE